MTIPDHRRRDHAHGASITGTYHEHDGKKGIEAVRTYADSIFPTFKDADHDGFPDNPDPDVTLAVQYANHPEYYENYHFQQKPTLPTISQTVTKQEAQAAGDKTEYHQVSTVVAKGNPARHHAGDPMELVPANIPDTIGDETHAADDVPLNAEGPALNTSTALWTTPKYSSVSCVPSASMLRKTQNNTVCSMAPLHRIS